MAADEGANQGSYPWLLVAPGVLAEAQKITLSQEEARHATGSLRRRAGDRVVLADGVGSTAEAQLIRCSRSQVVAEVGTVNKAPLMPGPIIVLGVLHTKMMDWAIQKAVEVGTKTFVPLMCHRSQGSSQRAEVRLEHWRRVADQALKQCRRPWAMEVMNPLKLEAVVEGQIEVGYVADRDSDAGPSGLNPGRPTLLVGPEGGLTSQELRSLVGSGWSTVALGPHILRAETAAIVGAAWLTMRLQTDRC